MGRSQCPRCGHGGLKTESSQRAMPNGETHKVTVQTCGECGWRNV